MNNEELKHLILKNELFQEIEKLKAQLYSKDQIKATCPNCGEEFLINQCRVVSDLQGQIEIMEKYFELIIDLGFDYDGLNQVGSLKGLIDELVRLASLGRVANTTEVISKNEENGKYFNILGDEINENSNKTN